MAMTSSGVIKVNGVDLESVERDTLETNFKNLFLENSMLLEALGRKTSELEQVKSKLSEQVTKNLEIDTLRSMVKQLEDENKILKEEKVMLEKRLEEMDEQLKDVRGELEKVHERLKEVESRDVPISIREAMRILERNICLAAAGSKRKFKHFYCFDMFNKSGDADMKAALQTQFNELKLNNMHINELGYLKDCGDLATHHQRPILTFTEWEEVVTEDEGEEGDEEASSNNKVRLELLGALKTFIPPDETTGNWVIEDPIEKPKVPKRKSNPIGAAAI